MPKKKKKPPKRVARKKRAPAKPKRRPAIKKKAASRKIKKRTPRKPSRDERPLVEVMTVWPDGRLDLHGTNIGRDERLIGRLIIRDAATPSRHYVANWDPKTGTALPGRMVLKAAKKKGKKLYHWQKKNLPPEVPLITLTAREALLPSNKRATPAEALEAIVTWAVSLDAVRMQGSTGYNMNREADSK